MKEPEYYNSNGLSPIGAFKQGLISQEEYAGFLKGNIIKYTIRAGKKEDEIKDLKKAKHYLEFYLELLKESSYPKVTVNVEDDLDWDELEKQVAKINDPSLINMKLSGILYDESGKLKPEVAEKINMYLDKGES